MSESGVIPPPEERLQHHSPVLTDWQVRGAIQCPECGEHFLADCRLEDVVRFTVTHTCAVPP